MTATNAAAIVRSFCAAWERLDPEVLAPFLHDDILYHNMPLTPLNGKGPVMDYLRKAGPFEHCRWEIVNLAVQGNTVLTERVDRFVKHGKPIALEGMGIFEIERGLIRVWRDYFDLAGYRRQLDAL
jgi:limonene-1,2-epoxide hydrolase